ncbi:general secretion pathway protein GspB [Alteromonas sp. CYL-A6]|uniref:general secretion pathway protein GspB n=1 Tax=Alteromonas nitratireducens TaxID=3390813 RepID=UPI0034B5815A
MSERIGIEQVKPGMVIIQITRQNGPVKIRKSGLVSSEAMVQGLAEMGVQEVEVDPEQTVEIATPVTHRTQTQALLRGQHDTTARVDHTLSDQFNRSLFLPTVQSLPSVWKLYLRQSLVFALIILGGLSIGFTAATYSLWWPKAAGPQTAGSSTESTVTPVAVQSSAAAPSEALQKPQPDNAAGMLSGETQSVVQAGQAQGSQDKATPEPAATTVAQQSASDAAPNADDVEGRILNQPQDSDVKVSADLLARFNKAVEALDNEAQDGESMEPKVTVHDNLPRVDQLPVRLLTRLPTMNFSAHMYASKKRDRWVRVNGKQLGEGDWIDDRVQIVSIEPQLVVLGFEEELFTMAALTDW